MWFLFGATLVHVAFDVLDVPLVVYAVASLTIIRAAPGRTVLGPRGLDRPSVAFIAWFGPRGLASIVFALLAVEELGHTSPAVQTAVAAVSLTVLLSVVLHGVSRGSLWASLRSDRGPTGRVVAQRAPGSASSVGSSDTCGEGCDEPFLAVSNFPAARVSRRRIAGTMMCPGVELRGVRV